MALSDATPPGFRFGAARCGLKNKRNDIGILVSDLPVTSAGVLTTNQVRAACVDHTRRILSLGRLQAIVVNSGNANCCTGEQGFRDNASMAAFAAEALELDPDQVAVSSTGVIGHPLDMRKVEKGIAEASTKMGRDPVPFIEAILTTDLVEKWAFLARGDERVAQPGDPVEATDRPKIFGVAKGSGMIAPNMATMLSYITTDYDVTHLPLDDILKRAVDKSFNSMTVDGDTSTNDTLLVLANGASKVKPAEVEFERELTEVCVSLARQIARDGEGATKLVVVTVTGTSNPKLIAKTIAESPLVKTAMFGCDPNWGRILMAAGRAGVRFTQADIRLSLSMGGDEYVLFENSGPAVFDPGRVSAALKADEVEIRLNLAAQSAEPAETRTVYTCDFGYGYVRINAEYHT